MASKYASIIQMGKILLLTVFFTTTPILIITTIFLSLFLGSQNPKKYSSKTYFAPFKSISYAALPSSESNFQTEIIQKNAKVEMLRQFFAKYNSPLEPYAQNIVSEAEINGLDFRLLPAIAMQESNLCQKIPHESYNCWGFGIYGGNVKRFNDYSHAISIVSKALAKEYKDKGLDTPLEIMKKYTPSSKGSWANGVTHFINQLQ